MGTGASKRDEKEEVYKSESSKVINEIVDRYLPDELVNNPRIPDFIEKRLYQNVVKIIIGIIKDTSEHPSVELLGHKITFSMEPIVSRQE